MNIDFDHDTVRGYPFMKKTPTALVLKRLSALSLARIRL